MKRLLVFGFVLFLFSSLFVFTGCYTTIFTDDRESSEYESVIPDSSAGVIQYYNYSEYQLRTGWYRGYRYPPWYRYPYQHNPWDNLWIGIYWNGYGFGYSDYWYNYPYLYYRSHNFPNYLNSDNWRWIYGLQNHHSGFSRSKTRTDDGERGVDRRDRQKSGDQNPPEERKRERVRDERSIEKQPSKEVTPRQRDKNTDKKRNDATRTPRTDSDRGKSSKEKPVESNPTQDRDRK